MLIWERSDYSREYGPSTARIRPRQITVQIPKHNQDRSTSRDEHGQDQEPAKTENDREKRKPSKNRSTTKTK